MFLFIVLWVKNELSYDKHNLDYNRIYQLGIDFKMKELEGKGISSTPPLAHAIMTELPEIEVAARFTSATNKLVTNEETQISFLENNIFYADSTIFKVFTIPILSGDAENLLTRRSTIVLSESTSKKYFNSIDPIGKTQIVDNKYEYEVVGVFKDTPKNSHWNYDMLVSMCTIKTDTSQEWLSDNLQTYYKLSPNVSNEVALEKINKLFDQKSESYFVKYIGIGKEEWEKQGNYYRYYSTRLDKIYLNSEAEDSVGKGGDFRYVYLFSIIGFFILFIACINFMNLSTARSGKRAKDIGIRKVLGSDKKQLIRQFLFESVLICTISMIIAICIIQLLLPYLNNLADKELNLFFGGYWTIPSIIIVTILVGLLAGSYSAFSLASFGILKVLKGSIFKGKSTFRNVLVLFQFSISILVIICTTVVFNQMKYVSKKKLGFQKDQLLIIDRAYTLENKLSLFQEELNNFHGIESVSITSSVPGKSTNGSTFQKEDKSPENMTHFRIIDTDYNYIKTLGIELLSGRFFSEKHSEDRTAVVINESGAENLGYIDPIGRKLYEAGGSEELTIIGVVKDYHQFSLHDNIPSIMLRCPESFWNRYIAVRFNSSDTRNIISYINSKWKEFSVNQPLEYFFMDAHFENLHKNDTRTLYFFTIFAILAIFIACLGLFGLCTFTVEQKTKEIGIRKVLGASINNVVFILLKQFIVWILLANLLAWPIGYFLSKDWLENFAYRINLNVMYFVLSGLITFVLATITISYLTIKAASRNPVTALKYE